VLPYFKKLESHPLGDTEYHGSNGLIHITQMKDQIHPLSKYYLEACKELGYPETDDFNGPNPEGVGVYDINVHNGKRDSSSFAYLHPILKRKNLTVIKNAFVEKISFDSQKKATGVIFNHKGKNIDAKANREVILAAGAVHTPALLQLSGVGDKEFLKKHNVPLVHHLPAVGKNLQDHVAVSYYFESKIKTLNDEYRSFLGRIKMGLQYLLFKKGPLSISFVSQMGSFLKGSSDEKYPNIQITFNPLSYPAPQEDSQKIRLHPYSGFLMFFYPCRPTSRGSVEIASNDPKKDPLIKLNYLSTEKDRHDAIQGGKLINKITQTKAFSKILKRSDTPIENLQTDDQILDYFRKNAWSGFHLSGSCAMGSDKEKTVVSSQLKVHGMDGLRIVDASVFPCVTSGNTNAAAMMVAEKGADLILNDNQKGY